MLVHSDVRPRGDPGDEIAICHQRHMCAMTGVILDGIIYEWSRSNYLVIACYVCIGECAAPFHRIGGGSMSLSLKELWLGMKVVLATPVIHWAGPRC
jgi:hypothetical protein